jgi:hypothetical protein
MGILRSQSFVLGTIYSGCQRYYALTTWENGRIYDIVRKQRTKESRCWQ